MKQTNKHWLATIRGLLLAVVFLWHQPTLADGSAIKLLLDNGTSEFFLLEDEPIAKFIGNTLVLSSKTKEISVILDERSIAKVVYVDDEPTSIEKVKEGHHPIFRINDSGLVAMGLEPKTNVFLYDLKGVLVSRVVVDSNGNVHLPINRKGIYVVKTSVSSFKIKK